MLFIEHYLTFFEKEDKEQYLDDVWNILQKSYAAIGGVAGLKDKNDLLDDGNFWKLVRKNGKIVAATIYKTKQGGRKIVAGGTDGTPDGKKAFYDLCREEVKRVERGTWAEVSGSMEGIFLFKLNATPIPIDIAAKILQDKGKEILSVDKDGFHYTRKIGGKPYEKIMFGNVPERYRNTDDWESESDEYRKRWNKWKEENPEEIEARKNRKH